MSVGKDDMSVGEYAGEMLLCYVGKDDMSVGEYAGEMLLCIMLRRMICQWRNMRGRCYCVLCWEG